MKNTILNILEALRQHMKDEHIDIYIVPSSDSHLSEYVAEHFKSRAYLTGFTGSAGTAVVTLEEAGLFTDGRYFIQAERELEGTSIDLYRLLEPGVPSLNEWLDSHLDDGMTLGFDASLFSYNQVKKIKDNLKYKQINYSEDKDLIDKIWENRPQLPNDKIFLHEYQFTGAHISEKIADIRKEMTVYRADTYLMNSLNDIAWLFNFRCHDISFTPVAYAYALITDEEAYLYINEEKVPETMKQYFNKEGVTLKAYTNYYEDLKKLNNKKVFIDPNIVNGLMAVSINDTNRVIEADDLTYMKKARFSDVEEKNLKNCQVRDGVAMVNFLYWFDKNAPTGKLTEHQASSKLLDFRKEQDLFIEPSFETIPAYAGNAAMMHYSTNEESSSLIENKGLFLIDSGGQYLDGTTDITRTIAVGPLTEEEKTDYTLVLKAHIALSKLTFLYGSTGANIDVIARQPIWAANMDYKSGTGHSVGYTLGVHEGPSRIRKESNVVLQPNMVLTNEPGIYKENKHGIRIENVMLVKEKTSNEMGTFMNFETISYCPIDKRAIVPSLLTTEEIQWLNDYHQVVYETLSPYVDGEIETWLKLATEPIE